MALRVESSLSRTRKTTGVAGTESVFGVEGGGWERKGNDGERRRQRAVCGEPCLLFPESGL